MQFQASPPVPSPADLAYFGFYVCVTAAIVCLVRRDHGSFPRALWLDGALGAAGAATALAAALSPVFSAAQGNLATVLVSSTYTAADLLVVAMIGGLLAVRGLRGGSMWLWMAGGLALFCAADVVYALQINAGTYEVGSWLSSGGQPASRASPSRSGGPSVRAGSNPAARGRSWRSRCSRP